MHRFFTLLLAALALAPAANSQTHSWSAPVDGNWDIPTNWSAGSTPNDPGHWAAIGVGGSPYTVTLNINAVLDRFSLLNGSATLEMVNRALTVANDAIIDSGTVNLINGGFNGGGQVTNRSLIYGRGSSSIENLYNDGTITVIGSPSGSTANLTLVAPAYSEGTINVTSEVSGYASNLRTEPGTTLSNFGPLVFTTGAGGTRGFYGALENNHNLDIGADTGFYTGPISNLQNTFHVFGGNTATFNNGCDFNLEGGILEIDGDFRMFNSAFTWNAGEIKNRPAELINNTMTIGPANTDNGSVRMLGSSSLTGTVRTGQHIQIVGAPAGSTAHTAWQGTGEQFNAGTISLMSESSGYQSELNIVSGASLTNNGTIAVYEGAGGNRYLDGDLKNNGQVSLFQPTRLQAGPLENTGLWEIGPGVLMDFNNSMDWTQSGSGTLQIDGRFLHQNGTDTFNGGNVTGTVELVNSQLTLGPAFTGTFEAWAQGSSTLTGDLDTGQTLYIRGAPAGSTATLNLNGSVENRGTMILDSINSGYQASLGTTDVAFLNSGNLSVDPGAGGQRYLRGDITNTGSLTIDANTVMQDGPIVNDGSWTIAAGDTMSFNSSMVFEQNSGTLQVDGTFTHVNGTDNFNGGTVNGTVGLVNSTLTLDPAFIDPVTILVQGSSNLTGDIESGQTMYVRGSAAGSTATLSLTGSTENRGDLIMDNVGSGYQVSFGTTDQPFLNSSNFTVEHANGGARYIKGDITNDSTMALNATTRFQDGPVINNGSLSIAASRTVDFNNSMTFEQVDGTLQIDGVFQHVNGTDRFAGGTVTGVPKLINSQLTLEPTFTTPVQIDLLGSSGLTGDIEVDQTLRVLGQQAGSTANVTVQAPMTNRGAIELTSEGSGYTANMFAPAGQELTNEGTLSVTPGAGGGRSLNMSLINSGLVELRATTTVGSSGKDHQNSGTIEVHNNSTFNGSSFTNLGGGRFESNVTITNSTLPMHNDGTWAPGFGIGTMNMSGAWSQGDTGKLEIEIGGYTAGTEYDQLILGGTATVGGEITLLSANGFQPKFGDQFTILTCSSTSGEFSGITYDGDLPMGYGFEIVDTGNSIIVQVAQTITNITPGTVDLHLGDPVPGLAGQSNTFQVSGATGGGEVYIVFGLATGTTAIGGPCPSDDFGIDSAQQVGSGFASYNGSALISANVPASAAGVTAYFQALDLSRCELSTVNTFQFP